MKKTTFAVIVGNRGFFPDVLAKQGRKDILDVLKKNGCDAIALSMQDTKYGSVETFADAKKCAELFAKNSSRIDGIIVTLPNFGDEKGVAEVVKRSGLSVPILIHAEPDTAGKMTIADRRDSFCGKMSVCNNLRQAGIPFTLTKGHTVKVTSDEFKKELDDFASICRIIRGLQNVRFGAIGARTGAFNTVRYSEKILELSGIAVETIDLSEILGKVDRLTDNDRAVKNKLNSIKQYIATTSIPEDKLLKMAKFGLVIDRWIKDNELSGTAIQCWTSLEEFFGIVPCSLMSIMSESLMPSACEVDITGLLGMYILQMASGSPSALLDWINASCSIAAICPNRSSKIRKWIIRKSSPVPSARKTPTAPLSAELPRTMLRSAGQPPMTLQALSVPMSARVSLPMTSLKPSAVTVLWKSITSKCF